MSMNLAVVATLRQWRKHVCSPDGSYVIWGYIYDDLLNRFPDGHFIHTARVRKVEGGMAYTANNVYKLDGAPEGSAFEMRATTSATKIGK